MPTHSAALTYNNVSAVNVSKTAGAAQEVDEAIPPNSTDLQIAGLTVDVSALQSIYLLSDKALTLETNSSSAPTETLILAANVPLFWTDDMPTAMRPFQSDVTALFVTELAGVAAQLKIQTLQDPTP